MEIIANQQPIQIVAHVAQLVIGIPRIIQTKRETLRAASPGDIVGEQADGLNKHSGCLRVFLD